MTAPTRFQPLLSCLRSALCLGLLFGASSARGQDDKPAAKTGAPAPADGEKKDPAAEARQRAEALLAGWAANEEKTKERRDDLAEDLSATGAAALPVLLAKLKADKTPDLRDLILDVIVRMEEPAAALPLIGLFQSVKAKDEDDEDRARKEKKAYLSTIGKIGNSAALEKLLPLLAEGSLQMALVLTATIAELAQNNGETSFVIDEVERLSGLPDTKMNLSVRCVMLLRALNTLRTERLLVACLRHESSPVRRQAMSALGALGSRKECVQPLIQALVSIDLTARDKAKACRTLGQIKALEAIEPLIETLEDDNAAVRAGALSALKMISGVRMGANPAQWSGWWKGQKKRAKTRFPEYAKQVESGPFAARQVALRKLVRLVAAQEQIHDLLIDLAEDSEPKMRVAACRMLAQFGSEDAIDALVDALDDGNAAVRTTAWNSLKRLTRQSLPRDARAWREWLRLRR